MSKVFSKEQLLAKAAPYFKKYKTDTLFAVSDGQIFIAQNPAELHAKGRTVYVLNPEAAPADSAPAVDVPTVAEIRKLVENADTVEKLRLLMDEEVKGPNRKSALEAIEKKIKKLASANSPELRGETPQAAEKGTADETTNQ